MGLSCKRWNSTLQWFTSYANIFSVGFYRSVVLLGSLGPLLFKERTSEWTHCSVSGKSASSLKLGDACETSVIVVGVRGERRLDYIRLCPEFFSSRCSWCMEQKAQYVTQQQSSRRLPCKAHTHNSRFRRTWTAMIAKRVRKIPDGSHKFSPNYCRKLKYRLQI